MSGQTLLSKSCLLVLGALPLGCDVEAVALEPMGVQRGEHGVIVVSSDYHSTSLAALGDGGQVASPHIVSSASAPAGLSAALGGDVLLPLAPATDELVLIDRSQAAVITWVDLHTAEVRAQLSVSTGFASNPHDYVPVNAHKAYVPRFAPNLNPGREVFDGGEDVLVIDPSAPEITGRIELSRVLLGEAEELRAHPDRALLLGDFLYVLVVVFDVGYQKRADSRLAVIDTRDDHVVAIHRFAGLTSCSTLAAAPGAQEIAVACNGSFVAALGDVADSAIVRLHVDGGQVEELARHPAVDLGDAQISALSYLSPEYILFTTYGRFSADKKPVLQDTLRILDLPSGEASEPILQTRKVPFSLGDVLCKPEAAVCFVTDAETRGGVVHRFELRADGTLGPSIPLEVDRVTGLPPRYLGSF